MSDINIDVSTRSNLQGFDQLDAAERAQILKLKQIEQGIKQAEAATQMYAAAAAKAHNDVARSAENGQRRIVTAYSQRMNLRHGAGTALTQAQRQELKAFTEQVAGQTVYQAPASVMATQFTLRQRQAVAASLREQRAAERARQQMEQAEADRQAKEAADVARGSRLNRHLHRFQQVERGDWERRAEQERAEFDRQTTMGGGFALASDALSGRRYRGESRLLVAARRRVARNLAKTAELHDKVTGEEFEGLVQQMAAKMEGRAAMLATAAQGAGLALGAAVTGLGAADSADRQTRGAAGDRIGQALASGKELRQIADSAADFRKMLTLAGALRGQAGLSAEQANATVFAGKSADLIDSDFVSTVTNAQRMSLDPVVALQAVQKIKSNWRDAGSTSEILGRLLIAAGPSPANVTDIAAGVGTSASAFANIGGTSQEAMAALGVLSGPNKNVDAAAERLKSVSDQLSKKMPRIVFDGKPLRGLELIKALPQLAREGRLRGEDGRQATVEDFLGEQQAAGAMRDIVNQGGVIGGQVAAMNAPGVGREPARRSGQFDLRTDLADLAAKNQNRQQFAEEKAFGDDETLANAVEANIREKMANDGTGAIGRGLANVGNWMRRGDVLGTGAADFAMGSLYRGQVTDGDTRRAVFDRLLAKADKTQAQQYLADVEAGRGRVANRMTLTSDNREGGKLVFRRTMTADEATAAAEAARNRLTQLQQDAAGGQTPQAGGSLVPFMNRLAGFMPAVQNFAGGAINQAGQFGAVVDAYTKSSGLSPNDYRVAIFNRIATQKAGEAAPAMLAANFIPGADKTKANTAVQARLAEIPAAADQAIYEANLKIIDDSLAQSEKDLAGATKGTAAWDRANARVKGIKGMKRDAKATGGRVDVFEAQSIVDQISGTNGDEKFKRDLLDGINKIVGLLPGLAAPPGGAPATGGNTTPKDFKPPAVKPPAVAKPGNRGAATVN